MPTPRSIRLLGSRRNEDIIVGYNNSQPCNPPSETALYLGHGTGTFGTPTILRNITNGYGQAFTIPKRLCRRFQFTQ